MKHIRSATFQEVDDYLKKIHENHMDNYEQASNEIRGLENRSWALEDLELVNEVGSIKKPHHHPDPVFGTFYMVDDNESWLEAFKRNTDYFETHKNHKCVKNIDCLINALRSNTNFLHEFPLIVKRDRKSTNFDHVDGIHRAFAYLRVDESRPIRCYVANQDS